MLEEKYYYVIRTHSHTDRQCLWKVMSRRIKDLQSAKDWKDFCILEDKKFKKRNRHEFFIIEKFEKS